MVEIVYSAKRQPELSNYPRIWFSLSSLSRIFLKRFAICLTTSSLKSSRKFEPGTRQWRRLLLSISIRNVSRKLRKYFPKASPLPQLWPRLRFLMLCRKAVFNQQESSGKDAVLRSFHHGLHDSEKLVSAAMVFTVHRQQNLLPLHRKRLPPKKLWVRHTSLSFQRLGHIIITLNLEAM